jgi:phosphonopyruvate decarboxylase
LKKNIPVAIIVKKGIVSPGKEETESENNTIQVLMNREDAIKTIIDNLKGDEVIISTTGKTSRELFEYRIERKESPHDFYTVGGMGCAASIALGIALQKSERRVFVLDGDGAVLMQMGSLATIGHYKPANFTHILFDNQSHESTGGQKTVSGTVDFKQIALACGYSHVSNVQSKDELVNILRKIESCKGPHMITIKVQKGARENLGRPTSTPLENKESFMEFIEGK